MKLHFNIISIVILILSTLFFSCTKKSSDEYIIGVAVPFSGQEGAATYGKNIKQACELAADEINKTGGISGRKIKLVYEDTKLIPSISVDAVTKLSTVDRVDIIIGDVASSSTIACSKVVEQYKTILISPASTSHEISGISKYVFRTIAPDTYEGEAMAEFCKNKGYRKVAICYVDNAGTKGPALIFKKKYEEFGLEVPTFEVLSQGSTDARTQMTKLISSKPDAVYLLGYALELGTMIKQFREQDKLLPIFSFQVMEEPKVREIAGLSAEGVIFTTPTIYEDLASGKSRNFIEKYKAVYTDPPGIFSANAYDAIYIIKYCIDKVGFDKEKIRSELSQISNFEGASGNFSINKNGDSDQKPFLMIVREGKIVKY
ncbi:MAG: hypothetical protein EHM58_01350 [Ignavibacteriae bacterium]|nr:MAG: hypothetical protein EHM58_01350 [Ignavibacteriota bacterium]